MEKFVDLEALNLRREPKVSTSNRVGVLHLGQPVELLGESDGWLNVKADIDGQRHSGFVRAALDSGAESGFVPRPTLRDSVAAAREALVAAAIEQWLRFARGLGKENVDPYFRFVGEMWAAIDMSLDGRDTDVPWSAAAISFMVRQASRKQAGYGAFRFAAAHARYMHDSIAKRDAGKSAPFWGFRLDERMPQIGDIVGRARENRVTFDDARRAGDFKSHSDVIVSINAVEVLAIGGNISNSVSISRYPKEPSGHLSDRGGAFMLMVNQLG